MDKRLLIVIVPALLFIIVLVDSYQPSYTTFSSGTREIEEDGFYDIWFEHDTGTYLELECSVKVTSGPAVDVLVLDLPNFERYKRDESFYYIEDLSYLGAWDVEISGTLGERDDYYLVFDNTDAGTPAQGGTAQVRYDFKYRYHEEGGVFGDFCVLFFLIITLTALTAYLFIRRSDKERRPLPPPPPGWDPDQALTDGVPPTGEGTGPSSRGEDLRPPPPPGG